MNSKRLQAIRYYLMTDIQKASVINQLPSDIASQLISYVRELSEIIPGHLSDKEKNYLLTCLATKSSLSDDRWEIFSELVLKEMSNLSVYPSKLRQALTEY